MGRIEAVRGEMLVPPIDSVAIVGRGQVGTLFAERFSSLGTVTVLQAGREEIGDVMAQRPEVVIAATPNPVQSVVLELITHAHGPFTLILPQNGVGVIEQAESIVEGRDVTLMRASLFTTVSEDNNGVYFNSAKLRMALAPHYPKDHLVLSRVRMALHVAGFAVKTYGDYRGMEWTKLVANGLGATSTITGLTPHETFANDVLFALELRGLQDRISIMRANGIKLLNIPWAKIPVLRVGAAVLPAHPPEIVKRIIAKAVASGRENLPSAASRKIMNGEDASEVLLYHMPFIQAVNGKEHTAPVDAAIVWIVRQHLRGAIDLRSMPIEEKIDMLLARYFENS